MKNHVIEKNEWEKYFDFISKFNKGLKIELEVMGLDVGDQIEEEWTSLEGLSYDPREDILHVYTASLDHAISAPLEIIAAEEGSGISAILIKDTEGRSQIFQFRSLLLLESSKSKARKRNS